MVYEDVVVLQEARNDIADGKEFYDSIENGVGHYFVSCILADLEALKLYAGLHKRIFKLFQAKSKRFPFSIYYVIEDDVVYILAILDMRQNPDSITKRIQR